MIRVREAVNEDADAIASLLTELGYPASASDVPGRLTPSPMRPAKYLWRRRAE
jgi:hypothetical protein